MLMDTLIEHWNFDLEAALLFILLTLLYVILSHGKWLKGAVLYFSGAVLMLFLAISPLHFVGMHYLLSAYMVMHILLLLICGPLILLGLPVSSPPHVVLHSISAFFHRWPWMGWLAGIGLMWFWHIPVVFDAVFPKDHGSFRFHFLPFLHTTSLLLAGVFFSWPIFGPVKELRIHPLVGVIYLFTGCIGCSILGLFLTFAPPTLYRHYFLPDEYGFSSLIRNSWNISRAQDQQAAGLMMWVPCCFIYLSGSLLLMFKWLNEKQEPGLKQEQLLWKGEDR